MTSTSPARNIVLTGFMGTGKSTIGRALAARLGWQFVDTDALIEAAHGPIPDIFATHGEEHFRELERQVASDVAGRSGHVVATGGRLMLDPANQATLGAAGLVVALTATAEEIHDRLVRDGTLEHRPLLAGPDPRRVIETLLEERTPLYQQFTTVATGGRNPEVIATDIAALAGLG